MEIYLDHASTTKPSDSVVSHVTEALSSLYGNPSSLHRKGMQVEKEIKNVKNLLAKSLKCNERELVFTSGGTEANNLAIKGVLGERKGRIITSAIEHPSVKTTIEYFGKNGCDVITLGVDSKGHISLEALNESLTPDTLLVSIMHVNNEIGSIQPIKEIGEMIELYNKTHRTSIKFHVDAVQSFGKFPLLLNTLKVDLMTFSGHKINALKGTGVLYIKNGVEIKPLVYGGQQEQGIRPGTENTLGILALGCAFQEKILSMQSNLEQVKLLKDTMLKYFESYDFIKVNGALDSPYVLNISIMGTKGEVMLHSLEMKEIYVSTGSACSSKKKNQSHVLKALGLDDVTIEGAIRLSFGTSLSEEEVIKAAQTIVEIGLELRKIMGKRGK